MADSFPYLVYLVFALGGAGLYFLMPRAGASKSRIGAVFGLAGVAALLGVFATALAPSPGQAFFYLFAVIALVGAARVVTHPVPVYSALYFVLVVVAVAAMLVLRGAEFAAIALIIVYAGAILVTYLFVIMLAQQEGKPVYDRQAREPFVAVLAGFVLMAAVAGKAAELPEKRAPAAITAADDSAPAAAASNTLLVGNAVMTRYIVPLQVAALLLLISMVGAIAMSRRRVSAEGVVGEQVPLGRAGKEVKPF